MRTRSVLIDSPNRGPIRSQPDLTRENNRKKEEKITEIIESVKNEAEPREEVMVCIREVEINRGELRTTLGKDVSRKVMQAYFKALNRENRLRMDIQSVKIFSIAFSQEIFGKGRTTTLHSKSDPLKYE